MATNPSVTLPTINMGAGIPAGQPRTPFFNPTVISKQQYLSGPVDFYSQTLDTTGVGVTGAPSLDEDETKKDTTQLGSEDRGDADDNLNALTYSFSEGTKPAYEVTSYGLSDINFGPDSTNTYDFTTAPGMTMDSTTGRVTQTDLNSDWSNSLFDFSEAKGMFDTLVTGAKAGAKAASKGPEDAFDLLEKEGFSGKNISRAMNLGLATPSSTGAFGDRPRATGPGAAVGAVAPGFSAVASIFGGMNMANQARNAAAFRATDGKGGALMDVNRMMVSRMPGASTFSGEFGGKVDSWLGSMKDPISGVAFNRNYLGGMHFVYDGNLGGLSHFQVSALEAQRNGYVPGTLTEEFVDGQWKKGGMRGVMEAGDMAEVGGTYNPKTGNFVTSLGVTAAMGSKKAAKAYVGTINRNFPGAKLSVSDVVRARSEAARTGKDFLAILEKKAQQQVSAADKTAENKTVADFAAAAAEKARMEQIIRNTYLNMSGGDDGGGGGFDNDDVDTGSSPGTPGGMSEEEATESSMASGGRVGMQEGGPAGFAERPEFVGGNQRPTDQQSIADDQPREVQEGTFVINSAAADEMGRDDVEKMIRQAYQKAGESGMGAGQQGMSQEVAIAVSRGEVTIPPHIAKIIGYDRLRKINNRGKKEVSRRQQERQQAAKGGFISRRK